MTDSKQTAFDPHAFLLNAGLGKRLVHLKTKEALFVQGDVADSVF
jgi:CRP/FNR family cyclic AMP-dependent transcriptional regulator